MINKNETAAKKLYQIQNLNENCLGKYYPGTGGVNVAWQSIDEIFIKSHASQKVKALALTGKFIPSQTKLFERAVCS